MPLGLRNLELLAFPWLFPQAGNCYHTARPIRLTIRDYFQSRILHEDNRFRLDLSYLFMACNLVEREQLNGIALIMTRVVKQHAKDSNSGNTYVLVSASDITSLDPRSQVHEMSICFMHSVRGTAAFWIEELWNLLARVQCLGAPDVFLTLSADDIHWIELRYLLQQDAQKNGQVDENNSVQRDPVIGALHFDRRLSALLKYIILDGPQPLGKVAHYYVRVEFQNRGSPHVHCFFWIPEAPSISKGSTESEFVSYIDNTISTMLPSKEEDEKFHDLVLTRQTHKHTFSCDKKGSCRFRFPRAPCEKTKVLTEHEWSKNRIHFYETKRGDDDVMLNAYNPTILQKWAANMDIQLVNGAAGLAYYVCKYALKAEPDDLRQSLQKLRLEMREKPPPTPKDKLFKIGMLVLKQRRLSAQEAAFRLCRLPLVRSSVAVVCITTTPPEKRRKLLRPSWEIADLPPDSTAVFRDNIIDYYRRRDDSLASISLYNFASNYKVATESRNNTTGPTICSKRRHPVCIRPTHMSPNTEEYFYSLLLLYLPHRNEDDLLSGFDNAREAFLAKHQHFDSSESVNASRLKEVLEAAQRLRIAVQLSAMDDNQPPISNETEDVELHDDMPNIGESLPPSLTQYDMLSPSQQTSSDRDWHAFSSAPRPLSELESAISSLTPSQKHAMKYIEQHRKKTSATYFHYWQSWMWQIVSASRPSRLSKLDRCFCSWYAMRTGMCAYWFSFQAGQWLNATFRISPSCAIRCRAAIYGSDWQISF